MKIQLHAHLFGIILTYSSFLNLQAQTISVVPNPNQPGIFAWTGSGALSGVTGTPTSFNNSLVMEYNGGVTSNLSQITQQLAVYKWGDSLRLIPNPDAGQGVYFQASKIEFNGKLFFIYLSTGGVQKLASFDGNSITLYPNPDAATSGVIGSFRILNSNLYLAYQNASVVTQLARFNGTGITLIPNPDNSANGYFNNFSMVFGNKLVSRYVTAAGPRQLAVFDGSQWTVLPNPDNTTRGVQPIFPIVYQNKLYFTYLSNTNQYQYLQYDGTSNPTLISNPQNSGTNSGGVTGSFQILLNDTLFLQYRDVNNVYRLAKFDGSVISLVPNPDATTYGYWYTPVVYNNNLYILYLPSDGSRHIAQYQPASNSLRVIANPDAGAGYWDQPIVYQDKLYIKYSNAQSVFQLVCFDGNSLQLITNPGGIYNSSAGYNGYLGQSVVWNDTLYCQMGSVPYGYAGNLARYATAGNGICPGSNTSFVSNLSGSSYQWQVDNGTGNFTNLTNAAPYSNVTTNTLVLTAPATALFGYKYRCVINGNTNSNSFVLKFASTWTGAISTAWENTANWSCGAIPDANTDVYIPQGKPNYPILTSNRSVRSIRQQSGTRVEVATGQKLIITGK
jgi:hypothetical protein